MLAPVSTFNASIMIRNLIIGAVILAHAETTHAQQALITRPDTLGANFDHAKPGAGTLADYDFLVGKWSFKYQARDSITGTFSPVLSGEWTGSKLHEQLFGDEWVILNASGRRAPIMTYRAFNAQKRVWEIQGVAVRRGVWQPGMSWSDGKDRFVVQENPETKIMVRIRYHSIEPNRFLWRADGSRDGGKTWMRDVMLLEATRITTP